MFLFPFLLYQNELVIEWLQNILKEKSCFFFFWQKLFSFKFAVYAKSANCYRWCTFKAFYSATNSDVLESGTNSAIF